MIRLMEDVFQYFVGVVKVNARCPRNSMARNGFHGKVNTLKVLVDGEL